MEEEYNGARIEEGKEERSFWELVELTYYYLVINYHIRGENLVTQEEKLDVQKRAHNLNDSSTIDK